MHPRYYSLLLLTLSAVMLVPPIASGAALGAATAWLVFLWPAAVFAWLGACYATGRTSWAAWSLGKSRQDGSVSPVAVVVMLPYLAFMWTLWIVRVRTCRRRERHYDHVVPGVYVGRYPYLGAPEDVRMIVDLPAEMPLPRRLLRDRRAFFLPTMDHCAPNVADMAEVANMLAPAQSFVFGGRRGGASDGPGPGPVPAHDADARATPPRAGGPDDDEDDGTMPVVERLESADDAEGEGVPVTGSCFVFCANGKGRSVAFVCVLLVMRGDAASVDDALALVRRARPQVNMGAHQRDAAEAAVAAWRASGGPDRVQRRLAAHASALEKTRARLSTSESPAKDVSGAASRASAERDAVSIVQT